MRTILKSLSIHKSLLCLPLLWGIVAFATSCREHEEAVPAVRSTFTLPMADTVQSPTFKAIAYSYYGRRLLNVGRYEDALQSFSRAAHLFRQKGLTASYANALRNMGRAHLSSFRPDSALHCYLRAQEVASEFDQALFMDISTELSIICRDVDDWETAKRQMLDYWRTSATDELPMRRLSKGFYVFKQEFAKGRDEKLSALQNGEFKIKDYRMFASQYQALYAEWCKQNAEIQVAARDLKEKYNNEVLKNENQLIKNELLRRKVWMLSIGAGAMLLIIAGFIGFYLYRRDINQRIGHLLARLQENEQRLDEGKVESEEERQRLLQENDDLSRRIEKLSVRQKDKDELNAYLQKQNISFAKQLKGYREIQALLPAQHTLALSQLCRLRCRPVYGLVKSEEEWLSVFRMIDTLYGDISTRLKAYKLSMQELRICYLIRAGFTNAMIATVSNVTTEAIAKSKQRMKAKFSLSANDSFGDFIRGN